MILFRNHSLFKKTFHPKYSPFLHNVKLHSIQKRHMSCNHEDDPLNDLPIIMLVVFMFMYRND